HLPARRGPGPDQPGAGQHLEDFLGGGAGVPAADPDRRHLRDELRRAARASLALRLHLGARADAGIGGAAVPGLPVAGLALALHSFAAAPLLSIVQAAAEFGPVIARRPPGDP